MPPRTPDYVSKSPAESRDIMRALAAGVAPETVVGTLLGRPERSDTSKPSLPKTPAARPARASSGPAPLQRAAGFSRQVIGAPAALASDDGPSDSALGRLFTALVVGAVVLELGSLLSGKFFNLNIGPFPARVTTGAPTGVTYTNPNVPAGSIPRVPPLGL